MSLVEQEPATIAWFALRLGLSEFGISISPTTRVGRRMCQGGPPRPLTGRSERAPGDLAGRRVHRESGICCLTRGSRAGGEQCRSERAFTG